jgi:hypothetical protein
MSRLPKDYRRQEGKSINWRRFFEDEGRDGKTA